MMNATVKFRMTLSAENVDESAAWTVLDQMQKDGPGSAVGEVVAGPETHDPSQGVFNFGLNLPKGSLGGDSANALSHLSSVLAGDLVPARVSGPRGDIRVVKAEVLSVELSKDLRADLLQRTRGSSHPDVISEVRGAFNLEEGVPLIAHTFKPRILAEEQWTEVESVLKAGFNLVEPDTRDTIWNQDAERAEEWVKRGRRVKSKRNTAFAPNLSGHFVSSMDVLDGLIESSTGQPLVVKIDAGIAGLDLLLAASSRMRGLKSAGLVTCYPLLNRSSEGWLGTGAWWDFASLCGADIIYPGNRPSLPKEQRPIWAGEELTSLRNSLQHYDAILKRRWPMPTVAGGVHAGQLQVLYELLGPDVAYFLGAPVSDHVRGREHGARLCVNVLEAAAEKSASAQRTGKPYADRLPLRLIKEVESSYGPGVNFLLPEQVFKTQGVEPFYRR